jgi:hypothetical protein
MERMKSRRRRGDVGRKNIMSSRVWWGKGVGSRLVFYSFFLSPSRPTNTILLGFERCVVAIATSEEVEWW